MQTHPSQARDIRRDRMKQAGKAPIDPVLVTGSATDNRTM